MRERPQADHRTLPTFSSTFTVVICFPYRPVTISTAAAALTSLAKLSLSGISSPQASTTLVSAAGEIESTSARPQDVMREEADLGGGISVSAGKGAGKKRGTIFKCESCSKVYRHPSCLIKHRWEHSPQWREASKLLLSKHQQVQLLEVSYSLIFWQMSV